MTTLNIRLTDQIEQQLADEARRENKTRSEIARDALTWYLTEIEKKRFMDQLLEEARAAYANDHIRREAMEIAEAFLPFENETPDNEESVEKWWK